MAARFRGIMPPVTTPFDEQGELLYDSLERNLRKYLKTGLSGFALLGSNGESPHLTESEKIEILKLGQSVLPADRYLIAGLSFATLRQSLSFVEKIQGFRIDALLVSTPSYYKNRMTRQALYHHYTAIADASPFPVLLYNVPQYSGLELPPELIGDVAAHPNIAGMKESSGNLLYLQRVLELVRGQDFELILGSAQVLGPALVLGIQAAIVAVACAIPELPTRLLADFQKEADVSQIQARIYEVSMALTARLGVAALKYAMDCFGYEGKLCRLPLLPLTAEEKAQLQAVLRPLLEQKREPEERKSEDEIRMSGLSAASRPESTLS